MTFQKSLLSVKGYTRPINIKVNKKQQHAICYDNESTALLSPIMNNKYNNAIYHYQQQIQQQAFESYFSHFHWLLSSVVPLVLTLVITSVGRVITISAVGHLVYNPLTITTTNPFLLYEHTLIYQVDDSYELTKR